VIISFALSKREPDVYASNICLLRHNSKETCFQEMIIGCFHDNVNGVISMSNPSALPGVGLLPILPFAHRSGGNDRMCWHPAERLWYYRHPEFNRRQVAGDQVKDCRMGLAPPTGMDGSGRTLSAGIGIVVGFSRLDLSGQGSAASVGICLAVTAE
jgi:hypothetical protein